MNRSESILVVCSSIFGTVLYAFVLLKGRIKPFSTQLYIDKTKLRSLLKFLALVIVVSVPFGHLITTSTLLVLKFVGLNVLIGAIMGMGLFMVRDRSLRRKGN